MKKQGRYIRASEVAEYVYCARAWRFRADGQEPRAGGERRAAGEAWHRAHGGAVARAQRLRVVARVAFALALALAILILLRHWR